MSISIPYLVFPQGQYLVIVTGQGGQGPGWHNWWHLWWQFTSSEIASFFLQGSPQEWGTVISPLPLLWAGLLTRPQKHLYTDGTTLDGFWQPGQRHPSSSFSVKLENKVLYINRKSLKCTISKFKKQSPDKYAIIWLAYDHIWLVLTAGKF